MFIDESPAKRIRHDYDATTTHLAGRREGVTPGTCARGPKGMNSEDGSPSATDHHAAVSRDRGFENTTYILLFAKPSTFAGCCPVINGADRVRQSRIRQQPFGVSDLAAVLATCHRPRRRGRGGESDQVALERGPRAASPRGPGTPRRRSRSRRSGSRVSLVTQCHREYDGLPDDRRRGRGRDGNLRCWVDREGRRRLHAVASRCRHRRTRHCGQHRARLAAVIRRRHRPQCARGRAEGYGNARQRLLVGIQHHGPSP